MRNSRPEAKDMTADSTVAEIEASGGTALGIAVDVRDHESVDAVVARVVQEWGRVDVLVANVGGGRGRPVDAKASTLGPALLELVVEMNLFGTVYSCNAVAPIMKQQRSAKIITVSSWHRKGEPRLATIAVAPPRPRRNRRNNSPGGG
jgi:3-oxoacyl-[acyl-carrier protein] reductase